MGLLSVSDTYTLTASLHDPLLQEAVTGRQPPQGYAERVLVFAETVAAANGVSNALEAVGVTALLYHKGISASDRAAALATMSK